MSHFDDVFEALDWTREGIKGCLGLEVKGIPGSRMVESFEEQTSDLCRCAPARPIQTASLFCQLTQKKVASVQIGGVLCRIRYSSIATARLNFCTQTEHDTDG